ncbi:major facilitator superfamily domain-containing protein [Dactylonectria macrodidyma]|uniref:Major facilitator superfamily domain-containing protein n=1 Tax=Dactylonectria macrodidyma TaxID=307937 RepID=A0A9P9E432_9HYPO|nr:major facilitator superfamily domain-containing protein [Dactylonectria macrodidyma]
MASSKPDPAHSFVGPQRQLDDSIQDVESCEALRDEPSLPYVIVATYWSFMILGMNDSSYTLQEYYQISHLGASALFLSPVIGFIISALFTDFLHSHLGRRGVAMLAGASQVMACTVACFHPPFYTLIPVFTLFGLSAGIKTPSWDSFIGGLDHPNELLGLLTGFYGLGATLMPQLARCLFDRGWKWFMLYYFMTGLVATDLLLSTFAFRRENSTTYRASATPPEDPVVVELHSLSASGTSPESPMENGEDAASLKHGLTTQCFKNAIVILCGVSLQICLGSEAALGIWTKKYISEERHGSEFTSGMAATGFWAGITLGRMCLGFVTGHLFKSEIPAVMCCLGAAAILEFIFWFMSNVVPAIIVIGAMGFFLGPLYPCAIACICRAVPTHMRTVAIGVCAAIGAVGAYILPLVMSGIVGSLGIIAVQPALFLCFFFCFLTWLMIHGVLSARP